MTRAQAAQMFYNLLLDQEVSAAARFTDVAPDAWYARAVETLASLGMVEGVGGGKFAPERTITRAEFTVMAMRFARLPEGGENPFSDVSSSDWFHDQVVGAAQYGWNHGVYGRHLRPRPPSLGRGGGGGHHQPPAGPGGGRDTLDDHAGELRQFPDVSASYWAYHDIGRPGGGARIRGTGAAGRVVPRSPGPQQAVGDGQASTESDGGLRTGGCSVYHDGPLLRRPPTWSWNQWESHIEGILPPSGRRAKSWPSASNSAGGDGALRANFPPPTPSTGVREPGSPPRSRHGNAGKRAAADTSWSSRRL